MNAWFEQLNKLIALREAGNINEDEFQERKKRLWTLEQNLDAFSKEIAKEEARFANDEIFQMRVMEFQIEEPNMSLQQREERFLQMQNDLKQAVEEAMKRMELHTTLDEPCTEEFTPMDPEAEAKLLQETQALSEELKNRVVNLRWECLDTALWTKLNQIEDALFRNGSEAVVKWNHRVLAQETLLKEMG